MIKKLFAFLLPISFVGLLQAQTKIYNEEQINTFFTELKQASASTFKLWNKDLYGPTLLVDPGTRKIYANEPDLEGGLQHSTNIYVGILPQEVNFSNTTLGWNGKRWAMIMLPLPENRDDRINLLAHESFHRIQPELGFKLNNANNNHLDEKDGRISLRLEFEALKKALAAPDKKEVKKHLSSALFFRKYRYAKFEKAAANENLLELNEGIAEFTGIIVSGRDDDSTKSYLTKAMDRSLHNRTFVRSFAYQTIPSYGYLLFKQDKNWNKKINAKTDLTSYFMKGFAISVPSTTEKDFKRLALEYSGQVIFDEENARDSENKRIVKEHKIKFVESPHFEIFFEAMNYSFDPRTIIPVENFGTYYPTTRITDVWGILTVEKGALISPDWKKVSLSLPTSIDNNLVKGEGWVLELKGNYTIGVDQQKNKYLKK
ncbi:hypothetical protein D7322_18475 [Sphingobacterium puteale]|uniref:Uncharacterized protein n=1 Tax=Sphingobacterium puteale TaxID=2420510 RepID=A0A420VUV7_9SPHI|nr:hypothetical protein [Sphingobacterium puteale]RKO70163.1 hypothetical protein D7322_18475 [Sphingobacterium puteale]